VRRGGVGPRAGSAADVAGCACADHACKAASGETGGNAATPAPADDNAFPEAQSEAAQKKAQAAQGSSDSSDSNAFPEAKSEAAQKQAESSGSGGGAPPSNGEPYSSSRSKSMSLNDLLGTGDSAVSDGAGHFINNDKLAKEDIRVGRFYLAQGNYPGAYMRLKEATEVGPGNVEAVYLLAEAARKTSHLDEAETNYKLYLQVEPDGKYAKDSLKALKELAGK
jgi:tetratricopeptide (TPR) repeat protein